MLRVDLPGPQAACAGVGPARPRGWRGDAAPRLRPHQGGHARRPASGFNPYGLRTAKALWQDHGLELQKTSGSLSRSPRRRTITFWIPAGTSSTRATLEEFKKDPESVHEGAEDPPRKLTLYPEWKYEGYAWGMAIDLNACTGCSACVVACQAENNIAVVGKDQVRRGRAMHWLRVDTYYQGEHRTIPRSTTSRCPACSARTRLANWSARCRRPATAREGLNDMVYNRCVGTRYCSNNCPYKVRRFNFYLFSDYETPSLKLLRNPDVTRAQPRRHGEVHVLRAANQLRQDRSRKTGPQGAGRRDSDRLPGHLPDRSHHFRQHQRSRRAASRR